MKGRFQKCVCGGRDFLTGFTLRYASPKVAGLKAAVAKGTEASDEVWSPRVGQRPAV